MITNKTAWGSALVWAIVVWAAWAAFVPDMLSRSTLLLVSVVATLVAAVIMATARNARPTESIAHVLHDAEQAGARRP